VLDYVSIYLHYPTSNHGAQKTTKIKLRIRKKNNEIRLEGACSYSVVAIGYLALGERRGLEAAKRGVLEHEVALARVLHPK
jgi:hypothetical protein